jgi:hypothetical protein
MTEKPLIFVEFDGDLCIWRSCGWMADRELMNKAKFTVRAGRNRPETIRLLQEAGFEVMEIGNIKKEDLQ